MSSIIPVNKIITEIKKLETFYEIGTRLDSKLDIITEYRYISVDNYLVFYIIGNEVKITRVMYGPRDYPNIIF